MKMRRLRLPSRHDSMMLAIGAVIIVAIWGIMTIVQHSKTPLAPETNTITSPWIPSTVKYWQQPIDQMAKKYKIDPNYLAIIMTMESGGYAKANSGEAQGLMQITPGTAKQIASTYLKKPVKSYNLYNPTTSIEFGAAYLSYLRDTFGSYKQGPSWNDTAELVAASYNGGPSAAVSINEGEGLTSDQTLIYSRDAHNMWRERNAHSSPTYNNWLSRGGSDLISAAKQAHQ
jgi:soluble lytic murein transglycosylase-like protein